MNEVKGKREGEVQVIEARNREHKVRVDGIGPTGLMYYWVGFRLWVGFLGFKL